MRKLILCFIAAAFFIALIATSFKPSLLSFSDQVVVYTGDYSSNATAEKFSGLPRQYFLKTGESFTCELNGFSAEKFLEKIKAETIFTEKTEEGVSYYAFTEEFPYRAEIRGKTVNVHIFVGKNAVTVGTPIIYGSF